MFRTLVTLIASAVLMGTAVACSSATTAARPHEAQSLAHWPYYPGLADLIKRSDLIIEGRVVSRLGTRDVRLDPAQRIPVSFTDSVVEVRSALKGQAAGQILVVQVGKEGDPAQAYPEFPVLKPGTEVLLFLVDSTQDPIHADGRTKFGILPPVGLLEIVGERVVTRAHGTPVGDVVASLTTAGLKAEIRRHIGN